MERQTRAGGCEGRFVVRIPDDSHETQPILGGSETVRGKTAARAQSVDAQEM